MSNETGQISVTLRFDRSTKRTHLYKAVIDASPISALYISKDGMPSEQPERIRVTVDALEDA